MKKNRIYTTIGIVGLIGIICFVIYLVGNFICFGVYEINEIINNNNNNNTNVDNACNDTNNNQYNQYNHSSPPVKGIDCKDSLDSLHIPHVIFDKELNCYAISLAGNNPEDIANFDELVKQLNTLEYNRHKYKDCTIEDIKLVNAHGGDDYVDNVHQAAEAIRYNLSHKNNPYDEGYDAGYDAGYETAKRELENK